MSLDRAELLLAAQSRSSELSELDAVLDSHLGDVLSKNRIDEGSYSIAMKSDFDIVDLRRLRVCRDGKLQVRSKSKGSKSKGSKKVSASENVQLIYDFEVDDDGSLYVDDLRLLWSNDTKKEKERSSTAYSIAKKLVKYYNKKDEYAMAGLFEPDAWIEMPHCSCDKTCINDALGASSMKLKGLYESDTDGNVSLHLDLKMKGSRSTPCICYFEINHETEKIERAIFNYEMNVEADDI